jgi:exosortase/archaeosortase family protein
VLIQQLRIPWTIHSQYAYGWAVPFLCLYLIWLRLKGAKHWAVGRVPPRAVPFSLFYLLFAPCALLYAPIRLLQQANPGWSLVSWPLALVVIALTFLFIHCGITDYGFRIAHQPDRLPASIFYLRNLAFPLGFFLVAVPWPNILESQVIQGLTRLNTALSIEILGWLGVPAMQHGNLIELATGTVGIDEACSGIRSLQATLMISLFLGELYRLTALRRVILCLSGFGIAMVCNLARMVLLTWVASRRGVEAIAGWHDPAGVTILVGCFMGLWAIGVWMKKRGTPDVGVVFGGQLKTSSDTQAPRAKTEDDRTKSPDGARASSASIPSGGESPKSDSIRPLCFFSAQNPARLPSSPLSLRRLSFVLAVWVIFVEIGIAAWYCHLEANLPAQAAWHVAWPETKAGFREVLIKPVATQMLRYDEARQGQWMEADGTRWQLSWFHWKAGQIAGYLAKTHNPLVCMPAAGFEVVSLSPAQFADLHGLRMPFRIYRFRQDENSVYVLYSRWEDRAVEQSFASEGVTRFNRLQSVWRGRGIHGQRVISLVLWGASDPEQARARLLRQLEILIIPDRP